MQTLLGLCQMNPVEEHACSPAFRTWMSTLADHLFELTYAISELGSACHNSVR